MDMNKVCITCLSTGVVSSLFSTECTADDATGICSEMLLFCCNKYISMNENFPKNICNNCIRDLQISYDFIKKCESTYSKICEYLASENNLQQKHHVSLSKVENEEYITDDCNQMVETFDDVSTDGNENDNCQENNKKPVTKKKKKKKKLMETEEYISTEYFCELCQKSFKNKKQHETRVHGERRVLQCERCSAIFMKPYSLSLHMRQHDNNLPHACTHPGCDKAFAIPSILKQHITSHSGDRPFVCQYCSHAARTKQQLFIHIRYHHTKEKNYVCSFCSKAFVSYQARYNHEKRHKNIRDHACQYCDKTFVSAGNLASHTITHTGVKNFECRLCGTRFSRKAHRNKHEANIHGVADQQEVGQQKSVKEDSSYIKVQQ